MINPLLAPLIQMEPDERVDHIQVGGSSWCSEKGGSK